MARKDIGTSWDRQQRNALNDNFIELFNEYTEAGLNAKEAKEKAIDALDMSKDAKELSERTQKELSQAILDGDSSPLGGQLSVGSDSTVYDNPQERLVAEYDKVTSQLADTATKVELQKELNVLGNKKMDKDTDDISVHQINKNKGLFDETYFSEEVKQQWLGETPIHSVPADRSITNIKIAKKAVTPDTTSFIDKSNNLIDISSFTYGEYIDGNGDSVKSTTYTTSNFIKVTPDNDYTLKNATRVLFYKGDKTYSHSYPNNVGTNPIITITSPSDVEYFKVTTHTDYINDLQMNEGNTLLPFEEYYPFKSDIISEVDLKNNQVNTNHVSFIDMPNNIYDKSRIEHRVILNANNQKVLNNDYTVSPYIKVSPKEKYTTKYVVSMLFYDINKNFIGIFNRSSGDRGTAYVFNTPANAYYIRVNVIGSEIDLVQINLGENILPLSEYHYPDTDIYFRPNIEESSIKPHHTSFVEMSNNIFDKKNIEYGYYIDDNGNDADHEDYFTTVFLNMKPNTELTAKGIQSIAFYNKEKNYIQRHKSEQGGNINETHVTSPSTAYYVRLSVQLQYLDDAQLNIGNELLPYEPFMYKLDERFVVKNTSEKLTPKHINETYESPTIPDSSIGSENSLIDYTLTDWYNLYDNLVSQYPDYVSKILLGNDASGNEIYKYIFSPEGVPDHNSGMVTQGVNDYLNVLITTGTHGIEIDAIYSLAMMFEQICTNWKNNKMLEDLRWNVKFTVIPFVCPYGLQNLQRKNINGVDLLRNFPNAWVIGSHDPDSTSYRGESPLSELEAQYVYNVYSEEKWDYVTDFHNFFVNDENNFLWNGATNDFMQQLSFKYIRKMSNKWKKEYEFLPQDDGYSIGYSNFNKTGIYYEAFLDGIMSNLTETCAIFPHDPNGKNYNSITMTASVEAITNWLYIVYRNLTEQ